MLDLKSIDELTRRLSETLPPGLNQTREEFERRFRAVLTTAFERMNLVTREEFESSMQLLEEARAKLADLESRLDELQSD